MDETMAFIKDADGRMSRDFQNQQRRNQVPPLQVQDPSYARALNERTAADRVNATPAFSESGEDDTDDDGEDINN
ncbi:hypothetical protein HDU97_004720 [Phlyctochytrium planicorne]|nr:hypothetical protein HDU97_004720 [Phlyctochytrium planicorne]